MELYGLNCVDLVVSYTIQFIFISKKCKFSKKKKKKGEKNHFYPPWSFQHTDCYTKNAVEKGVKVKSLHWTV